MIGDATVGVSIAVIHLYRVGLRPLLGGGSCRYDPSCSSYAEDALRRHGPTRGVQSAASRILRCHPWSAGGYDPVPDEQEQ